MEMIGEFFRIAFTTAWLWLSIPVCIFLFFYTIHRLLLSSRKSLMKTWRVGDVVYIEFNHGGDNLVYKKAKATSTSGDAVARLKKWNTSESLVELKNGEEYFINSKRINNKTAYDRVRESEMDYFMEENNGIKSKAERRDDAIDSVIGDDKTDE